MSKTVPLTLPFESIDSSHLALVGGKGANLGDMTQAGFPVPPGFCVTTAAFAQFMATCSESASLYAALDTLRADDVTAVRQVGEKVRTVLAAVPIPPAVQKAILAAWREAGIVHSYAVRSSATAEDLPDASFAGQQDTFLNVRGADALLDSVRRCWVSLFTDRAILYRIQNQFGHRDVLLSVVIQRMVLPRVSGILFTADPVSGHRHIASVDASYGLGEALVSGIVNADLYKVDKRTYQLMGKTIGDKTVAILPLDGGGTTEKPVDHAAGREPVLSDRQAVALARLGSQIEQHYGRPQDIEWCLENEQFWVVQSRPITTLYPVPQPAPNDGSLRIYFSFGHAQVMTDPISPMGISLWRHLLPIGKKSRPLDPNPYMLSAGGRIYVDLTPLLHMPAPRRMLPAMLTNADPLAARIIKSLIQRGDFVTRPPRALATGRDVARWLLPLLGQALLNLWWRSPEKTALSASERINRAVVATQAQLQSASPGGARLRSVRELIGHIFLDEAIHLAPYVMSGLVAQQLLVRIAGRMGMKQEAEATMRGLSGNVTTEMDLAVGDLADAARQSETLVAQLQQGAIEKALQTARSDAAAKPFWQAWQSFLQKYGMRGPSEIDIARPRYRDEPASVLRMVAGSLGYSDPGAHRRHHLAMMTQGEEAGERLVTAVNHGPFGWLKAKVVRRLVRVSRSQAPLREHPKFLLIQIFGMVRETLLDAGQELRDNGRLNSESDVWMLSLTELIALFENELDDPRPLIAARRAEMALYRKLKPPRIITSDGETPKASHARADIPSGALAGSAVSAGVVEGIARVVLDPTRETLNPGEILVAPFTDPGWTPLFINAAGLVMEVGGLLTHGSVVAREYGIPAVVAVPEATTRIQTGQTVRVHGDGGYVEIL